MDYKNGDTGCTEGNRKTQLRFQRNDFTNYADKAGLHTQREWHHNGSRIVYKKQYPRQTDMSNIASLEYKL